MHAKLGGDDPFHDLSPGEKDRMEVRLKEEARNLLGRETRRERNRKMNRANEISRRKAKRAHRGTD
jgi:hypothetical protein